MLEATWQGATLAQADADSVERVENNVYFPPDSIRKDHFQPSDTRTECPWKGTAHYYNVVVNGEINRDAAWFYPEPKAAAKQIAGHVAFWKGVQVRE